MFVYRCLTCVCLQLCAYRACNTSLMSRLWMMSCILDQLCTEQHLTGSEKTFHFRSNGKSRNRNINTFQRLVSIARSSPCRDCSAVNSHRTEMKMHSLESNSCKQNCIIDFLYSALYCTHALIIHFITATFDRFFF